MAKWLDQKLAGDRTIEELVDSEKSLLLRLTNWIDWRTGLGRTQAILGEH